MAITVTSLWQYPVKSMAGVALASMAVNSWGPSLDRRWMLVDSQHRFITQRQLPYMCRLAASLTRTGIRIQSLDDALSIDVPQPVAGVRYDATVWSDTCEAVDAGDEAAAWLSKVLGKTLQRMALGLVLPMAFRFYFVAKSHWLG